MVGAVILVLLLLNTAPAFSENVCMGTDPAVWDNDYCTDIPNDWDPVQVTCVDGDKYSDPELVYQFDTEAEYQSFESKFMDGGGGGPLKIRGLCCTTKTEPFECMRVIPLALNPVCTHPDGCGTLSQPCIVSATNPCRGIGVTQTWRAGWHCNIVGNTFTPTGSQSQRYATQIDIKNTTVLELRMIEGIGVPCAEGKVIASKRIETSHNSVVCGGQMSAPQGFENTCFNVGDFPIAPDDFGNWGNEPTEMDDVEEFEDFMEPSEPEGEPSPTDPDGDDTDNIPVVPVPHPPDPSGEPSAPPSGPPTSGEPSAPPSGPPTSGEPSAPPSGPPGEGDDDGVPGPGAPGLPGTGAPPITTANPGAGSGGGGGGGGPGAFPGSGGPGSNPGSNPTEGPIHITPGPDQRIVVCEGSNCSNYIGEPSADTFTDTQYKSEEVESRSLYDSVRNFISDFAPALDYSITAEGTCSIEYVVPLGVTSFLWEINLCWASDILSYIGAFVLTLANLYAAFIILKKGD